MRIKRNRIHGMFFWISINRYALLLDAISLIAFTLAITLQLPILHGFLPFFALSLASLMCAVNIHKTYHEKVVIFQQLIRKNIRHFDHKSFCEYMGVPCHRVVSRMALAELHKEKEYSRIKQLYYKYPWKNTFPKNTVLVIHNPKLEEHRYGNQ